MNRTIDYLRISVTDRCNLRCVYCMPEKGVPAFSHDEVLRYEEIERVAHIAVGLGIVHLRLTGGEPLVRKGIVDLVAMLARIPGLESLAMTTNGTLLAPMAHSLRQAGLQRVNISLDTLRPERFRAITRRGELADALAGIEAAHAAGLEPVKINVVPIRGLNDDEVVDFARLTLDQGWHVRFIEWMPLGESAYSAREGLVSGPELRRRIEETFGPLAPAEVEGNGPARVWRIAGASGTIGLISALSEHFCHTCNRLRLTSTGALLPCLFSNLEFDLRTPLRAGADDATLRRVFREAIAHKPACHRLNETDGRATAAAASREMSRIGG
ncbi:MAG: GTP 3',8-cyclase MoaA [Chloroflexi bacterium]|nr:GTP 3',8-cyclase MoaA [Chloroflexota bacterium]